MEEEENEQKSGRKRKRRRRKENEEEEEEQEEKKTKGEKISGRMKRKRRSKRRKRKRKKTMKRRTKGIRIRTGARKQQAGTHLSLISPNLQGEHSDLRDIILRKIKLIFLRHDPQSSLSFNGLLRGEKKGAVTRTTTMELVVDGRKRVKEKVEKNRGFNPIS